MQDCQLTQDHGCRTVDPGSSHWDQEARTHDHEPTAWCGQPIKDRTVESKPGMIKNLNLGKTVNMFYMFKVIIINKCLP